MSRLLMCTAVCVCQWLCVLYLEVVALSIWGSTLKRPKSHTSSLFYEFNQSMLLRGLLPYSSLMSFCKAKMQFKLSLPLNCWAGISVREGGMLVVNDYCSHRY